MQIFVALFRGINVGGKNKLPMSELKSELAKIGLPDAQTYVQSGNVVFRAPKTTPRKLAEKIGDSLYESRGFRPHVLVLTRAQLQKAIEANPFPVSGELGNTLHLFFLSEPPAPTRTRSTRPS